MAPGTQPMAEVPEDLLASGKMMMKVGTPFVTAMKVQQPRNIDSVIKNLMVECEYGGEEFYYSINFGGNRIGGPSIGLALSIMREFGNCAVTMAVEEGPESFIMVGRFIDLEKGFQVERAFRQRKGGAVHGKFDPERKLDIAFQIGQSKCLRNVITNGVPKWLVKRCIDAAKTAVAKNITPEGLEKAKQDAIAWAKRYKVTEETLVEKVGKPVANWINQDIADLRGDFQAIKTGEMSVAELFPPKDPEAPKGPVDTAAAMAATAEPEKKKEEPKAEKKKEATTPTVIVDEDPLGVGAGVRCPICGLECPDQEEVNAHLRNEHKPGDKPAGEKKAGGDLFGK